ncbi:hypothetical protein LTS03_002925 [Exophiala xenobiotica]|nr:hypothetical protein LTS06_000701 [Exophiala xenobiotica]KAK5383676.1 hypothetical protein LTR11_002685 [Exophiala xenobiotica]KAK5384961.1 hypothetical protein LTS03_002925 [Exophiala xenobiotica]
MSRADQRVPRGVAACQRCRRRKQKCDQKHPNCSNCERANVPCLTYHSAKQADIPRNYVSDLEAQVEKLTREIQELRGRTHARSTTDETVTSIPVESSSQSGHEISILPAERLQTSDGSSSHFQDLVASVRNVVVEPSTQPRFLGQSSGISFARMVMAAIQVDALPSPLVPERQPCEPSLSAPTKASLPPRHVADHLVDVYFQYRTPHLPILDRSQVEAALESVYLADSGTQLSDRVFETDMFTTYMVFAIALCDVPHSSGGRPSQSEGCFFSALGWVEKVLTYSKSDLETLRAVLLLAQFVALFPSRGSLWHLTGFALRLCIDVGLHWETDEQSLNMDPDLLNDRRRLWYSTYQFDRLLCITLGRPFGILDESTRVQLPNPWKRSSSRRPSDFDIHTERAYNHLFTMSKLESEIKHVHHNQVWALKLAYPRANHTAWVKDILPRLQEWYATIPDPTKAHPSSIFASQAYWEVIYNNAVLLLYRPHSLALYQSTDELLTSFEASCKVIASLKALQRDGRVEMLWKSVHHLFMAGLGVIYGLWHSKDIRDRNPVGSSIATLQSCASTLCAMSETFPGAVGCRDAFDTLSSATIDWLVTRDVEDVPQNRLEFEKQVKEVMQQLQLSREGTTTTNPNGTDNMSAMLSTDNFEISEMLNSAAQWPELGEEMNFSDLL